MSSAYISDLIADKNIVKLQEEYENSSTSYLRQKSILSEWENIRHQYVYGPHATEPGVAMMEKYRLETSPHLRENNLNVIELLYSVGEIAEAEVLRCELSRDYASADE